MDKPVFETVADAVNAARVLDGIAPLYEHVFAEPPYFEGPRDLADFLEGYAKFRFSRGRTGIARSWSGSSRSHRSAVGAGSGGGCTRR
ncbi:hypothetical protein [Streptomyces sp. Y1]|uniref:Uncharacterized protein n=1 Tax=Streptomyces sp. Y1 TaxID=3238634 RepID=A0AB39TY38_9ACTN